MSTRLLAAILGSTLLLGLAGCDGEPTIDATSEETLKTSVDAIAKGITDEKKREKFEASVMSIALAEAFGSMEKDEKEIEANMKKALHGKTADQIIADAEKLGEKMKNQEQMGT